MVVVGTSVHCHIARAVAAALELPLRVAHVRSFSDSEQYGSGLIAEQVAGHTVVLVWTYRFDEHTDINTQFFSALSLVGYIRGLGARRVIAVCPYLAYGRQSYAHGMLSTALAMLHGVGVDRLIVAQAHVVPARSPVSLTSLSLATAWGQVLKPLLAGSSTLRGDWCVIAPDTGGVARAGELARLLQVPIVALHKERCADGAVRVHSTNASALRGTRALIVDDVCDRGTTIAASATFAAAHEAREVYAAVTHGVLSGEAEDTVSRSACRRVLVSNLFDDRRTWKNETIFAVSMHEAFAQEVARIVRNDNRKEAVLIRATSPSSTEGSA